MVGSVNKCLGQWQNVWGLGGPELVDSLCVFFMVGPAKNCLGL